MTTAFSRQSSPFYGKPTEGPSSFGPRGKQLRALKWIHQQPADGHLSVMMQLTDIFSTGPPLPRKQLDIIIADTKGMSYPVL